MITDKNKIEAVTDKSEIDQALALIEDVVEKPYHLNEQWIMLNGWTAIPVESPIYEREAEWLSEAAMILGCDECLAVATEPQPLENMCYRVPMSLEGVLNFDWECHPFNYVLLPESRLFAVLHTTEDYSVVAGPSEFVAKAIGCSISVARQMFYRFANDLLWEEDTRTRLLGVADKYKSVSEKSEQGYELLLS